MNLILSALDSLSDGPPQNAFEFFYIAHLDFLTFTFEFGYRVNYFEIVGAAL